MILSSLNTPNLFSHKMFVAITKRTKVINPDTISEIVRMAYKYAECEGPGAICIDISVNIKCRCRWK